MRGFDDQSVEVVESILIVVCDGENRNSIQILTRGGGPYNGMQRACGALLGPHGARLCVARESVVGNIALVCDGSKMFKSWWKIVRFLGLSKDEAVSWRSLKTYRGSTAGALENQRFSTSRGKIPLKCDNEVGRGLEVKG